MNVLLAGRDTTASILGNLWFVLARRPDVWAKLKEEANQLNGEKPTYDQLNTMNYLRYCIDESLRLHPPVPMNNREATRDTVLPRGGGPYGTSLILVPAGSIVGWYCYSMHRRADIFGDDAEEFRPERWTSLRPGWACIPFDGGPRVCLGQQLALTTASCVTVSLMQAFESIEPRDLEPWREGLTLTCASHNGVKVS
jgi:cytochrome P450